MPIKFSIMLTGMLPMQEYVQKAAAIERYGFDELHIADDLIFRPAWPILTLIGANTERIKLGPAIVTPQVAHPVYHAANLAALDELTGGRAICGVGRGGFNALLGIDKPHKPIKMLREAVQLMRRMLAGERTPFDGEFFQATSDLYFQFAPPRREIPIFIGTWGPKISALAGEIASGLKADCTWNPFYLEHLRDQVFAGAARAGRDPGLLEITVGPLCSISRDRTAAFRQIRRMLALLLPFLAPMTEAAGVTEEEIRAASKAFARGDFERAEGFVSDQTVRAFSVTGTPEDVIPEIKEIIQAGATHIAFGPPLGPDFDEALRLLGEEIVPSFRQPDVLPGASCGSGAPARTFKA